MDQSRLLGSINPYRYILELVDEYTLYCFYTHIEDLRLNKHYNCPYRIDTTPSFGIYLTRYDLGVEYFWKDLATGESGNIYKLIQKIEGLRSHKEVFQKINQDFDLGLDLEVPPTRPKIILYPRLITNPIKITTSDVPLTPNGVTFWKQFEISKELLDYYNTTQIQWYWSFEGQEAPKSVLDPTFAYRIGKYYQIYSPYASKDEKFRNDYPEHYFFGYMQLPKQGKILIIDKSCKDVIFCRKIGYEAICPKSETTMLPQQKMLEIKERFKEVYLMLDNDKAGIAQTEKYTALYPWLKPRFLVEAKDKTDLCLKLGIVKTKEVIDNILNDK